MKHLSDWRKFARTDRETYPRVDARVQVEFENGRIEEGDSRAFFPRSGYLPASTITAWRYLNQLDIG
jgi:hypothetical protein